MRYLEPFVHYIPLKEDLSDLNETMHWVRDHPNEVKAIAERGRQFYDDYLSFPKTADHWYEFLYKLSIRTHVEGGHRSVDWHGKTPDRFVRSQSGEYHSI